MLAKLNSRFLATAVSVAALTVGMSVAHAQKASAVTGTGSTAAADLYTSNGASYSPSSSSTCSSGTDAGFDFCATDIPFAAADGYTITQTANLRIAAPVNGGDTGLSQDQFCAIIRGEVTTFSNGTPITVVYRLPGSGTGYIVNSVCGADGSQVPGAIGVGSSGAVVSTVQSTPGAIGYAEEANLGGTPSALAGVISGPTYAIYNNNNTDAQNFLNNLSIPSGYNPR